jgi:hypothetical protein
MGTMEMVQSIVDALFCIKETDACSPSEPKLKNIAAQGLVRAIGLTVLPGPANCFDKNFPWKLRYPARPAASHRPQAGSAFGSRIVLIVLVKGEIYLVSLRIRNV